MITGMLPKGRKKTINNIEIINLKVEKTEKEKLKIISESMGLNISELTRKLYKDLIFKHENCF